MGLVDARNVMKDHVIGTNFDDLVTLDYRDTFQRSDLVSSGDFLDGDWLAFLENRQEIRSLFCGGLRRHCERAGDDDGQQEQGEFHL